MSRYLIEYSDINEENELFYYLLREELWPIEDWKNKDLIEKDLELLKHNNIKISNCYEFYKLLGENESEEILRGIDLNPKIKKDEDDEGEEDDENDYNRDKYKYGDEDNYIDERILTIKKKRKQNMIW